jgi:hypothetical protein
MKISAHLLATFHPNLCPAVISKFGLCYIMIMVTTEEELYCYWLKAIVISILMFYEPVYQEIN